MTFIEAADWQIIDTWDTVGLRATGSHDVEVVEVFVPARRTFPLPLPEPVADGALFRFPLVGLFSIGIAACALGIAQAAIDDVVGLARHQDAVRSFRHDLGVAYDHAARGLRSGGRGPRRPRVPPRGDDGALAPGAVRRGRHC